MLILRNRGFSGFSWRSKYGSLGLIEIVFCGNEVGWNELFWCFTKNHEDTQEPLLVYDDEENEKTILEDIEERKEEHRIDYEMNSNILSGSLNPEIPDVGIQTNSWDCGVYLLSFAECFFAKRKVDFDFSSMIHRFYCSKYILYLGK